MAEIGQAPEGFPRKMQAARALAGLTIDKLAERINERGLSARSLRDIESGETKDVQRSRQVAIIEACGLPAAFLTADLMVLDALEHAIDNLPAHIRTDGDKTALILRAFKMLASAQTEEDTRKQLKRLDEAITALREQINQGPTGHAVAANDQSDQEHPQAPQGDDAAKSAAS
jgi:transcriptional regulator with XRE-family HTH domain